MGISAERLNLNPVICDSCGHVNSATQKNAEAKQEKSFLLSVIALSIVMVGAFVHVVNWGSASVEVVKYQVADILGANSAEAVDSMARACMSLKKYDCVEKMYAKLARNDAKQYARLGQFQLSQRHFQDASESYRRFFATGGTDVDANYNYARALGETGNIDEAAKHFDYVLAAKPGVMQITVMHNYVKFLISANRLDQAKQVIEKMRRRDQTVGSFMEAELKEIETRLKG